MTAIRWFLAIVLKMLNFLTLPKPVQRTEEEKKAISAALANHSLYHLPGCPFCLKVRRQTHRLQLPIEERDIKANQVFLDELVQGGGRRMVPCLRIDEPNGETRWMYESGDIIAYLQQRFEPTS
ncbi:Uncharacterised protein [BD1-7 clade bacterium]|uniref:GST N-terminal domain-containing protein n=1 Tax=BD1-7 clade bacterium TaxID=2029982 RepID=A0A5S9PT57_9GAMM|nr:Uncharacterised protein [BD1-7 clade bacterium]